jgi:LPXTG-motif cell wall-anchored protein
VNQTPFPSSRRHLRRLAALGGSALLGMTAVLTLAGPASAHYPTVKGEATCDTATGDWSVTWKVANSEGDITGELTEVSLTPAGTTVTNIEVGAALPKSGDGPLVGVQNVGNDQESATLKVKVEWIRGKKKITEKGEDTVKFKGDCKKEEASPSPSASSPVPPPAESASPAPGAGGGGPTLPTTGASIGTAVGIAAVLLAAGAGLFFFFRRRRIRFTA